VIIKPVTARTLAAGSGTWNGLKKYKVSATVIPEKREINFSWDFDKQIEF